MKVTKYKRGQIWWYRTNGSYDGSIQGKSRPVIIVSNDLANANSNCLIGIPCTSQEKKNIPTHITFNLNGTYSTALAENLLSINVEKLSEYIGTIDNELLEKINEILSIALGLKEVDIKESIEEVTTLIDNDATLSTESEVDTEPTLIRRGRYPKYTPDEMIRYINDYTTHNIDFMIKKYNECSANAIRSKINRFKKILNNEENK